MTDYRQCGARPNNDVKELTHLKTLRRVWPVNRSRPFFRYPKEKRKKAVWPRETTENPNKHGKRSLATGGKHKRKPVRVASRFIIYLKLSTKQRLLTNKKKHA